MFFSLLSINIICQYHQSIFKKRSFYRTKRKNSQQIGIYSIISCNFGATVTGYGCVNSKQAELRDIKTGTKIYEIYTFPHPDGKTLNNTLSCQTI